MEAKNITSPMAAICPGSRWHSAAGGKDRGRCCVLKGWQLLFGYYATVEPAEGKSTPVLGFGEITSAQEQQLDEYEGLSQTVPQGRALAVECALGWRHHSRDGYGLSDGTPSP